MSNPFADALKDRISTTKNHMSFEDQCGYYGALMSGVPNGAVALAANISQPTVTYLRAAGTRLGGQIRYARIAREFESLGREAFVHKYVTAIIRDRCLTAIDQIDKGLAKPRQSNHVKARKSGLAGRHTLKPRTQYAPATWSILIEPRPSGWFYLIVNSPFRGDVLPEHAETHGPYETAQAAFRQARDTLTPED